MELERFAADDRRQVRGDRVLKVEIAATGQLIKDEGLLKPLLTELPDLTERGAPSVSLYTSPSPSTPSLARDRERFTPESRARLADLDAPVTDRVGAKDRLQACP